MTREKQYLQELLVANGSAHMTVTKFITHRRVSHVSVWILELVTGFSETQDKLWYKLETYERMVRIHLHLQAHNNPSWYLPPPYHPVAHLRQMLHHLNTTASLWHMNQSILSFLYSFYAFTYIYNLAHLSFGSMVHWTYKEGDERHWEMLPIQQAVTRPQCT
jgi:hypothetical protein